MFEIFKNSTEQRFSAHIVQSSVVSKHCSTSDLTQKRLIVRFCCVRLVVDTTKMISAAHACIYQLLDEGEQNIVICWWREDQLLANAEGRGKFSASANN